MVALHVGRPHVLLSGIYQLSDAGGQACYAYNLCVQVNRYKYSLTVLCNPQLLTNLNAYKRHYSSQHIVYVMTNCA